MNELQDFVNEVSAWAARTFPATSNRPLPKLYHLQKEVKEVIEAIEDNSGVTEFEAVFANEVIKREFADCFILFLQAADKFGMSMEELLHVSKNKFRDAQLRTWGEPDEHGVVEHIRVMAMDTGKGNDKTVIGLYENGKLIDQWEQLMEDGKPPFPEFPHPVPPAIMHVPTRTCSECGHTLSLEFFEPNEPRCGLCDVPPAQQIR